MHVCGMWSQTLCNTLLKLANRWKYYCILTPCGREAQNIHHSGWRPKDAYTVSSVFVKNKLLVILIVAFRTCFITVIQLHYLYSYFQLW